MKNRFRLARAFALAASVMLAVTGCSLNASPDGMPTSAQAQTSTADADENVTSSDSEESSSAGSTTSESASSKPSESASSDSAASIPDGYKQVTTPNVGWSFAIPSEWVNALDDPELRKAVADVNSMTEDELIETFDVFYQAEDVENDFVANINVNSTSISAEIPDEALLRRVLTDITNYRTVETAAGEVAVINIEDPSGIQCIGVFAPADNGEYHGLFINTKSKEQTQELADAILATLR